MGEIGYWLKKNRIRSERIREYFLNLFKQICSKQDMRGELEQTMD